MSFLKRRRGQVFTADPVSPARPKFEEDMSDSSYDEEEATKARKVHLAKLIKDHNQDENERTRLQQGKGKKRNGTDLEEPEEATVITSAVTPAGKRKARDELHGQRKSKISRGDQVDAPSSAEQLKLKRSRKKVVVPRKGLH
jgi:hypothetical protein